MGLANRLTGLNSIAQGDPTTAAVDGPLFKVFNVVEFAAPLDWVWKWWPLNFDISKVMTDDPTGLHRTIGVVSQRTLPASNGDPFNAKGSHILYTLVGGKEVDEIVLQRDSENRVYEYVYSLGFAEAQGHMIFESTGPRTSRILWTYWIKPASDEMKAKAHGFMNQVWGPFIVNHCCPNLKAAVEGLYAGDESYAAKDKPEYSLGSIPAGQGREILTPAL
jgi:hypothetical protein